MSSSDDSSFFFSFLIFLLIMKSYGYFSFLYYIFITGYWLSTAIFFHKFYSFWILLSFTINGQLFLDASCNSSFMSAHPLFFLFFSRTHHELAFPWLFSGASFGWINLVFTDDSFLNFLILCSFCWPFQIHAAISLGRSFFWPLVISVTPLISFYNTFFGFIGLFSWD